MVRRLYQKWTSNKRYLPKEQLFAETFEWICRKKYQQHQVILNRSEIIFPPKSFKKAEEEVEEKADEKEISRKETETRRKEEEEKKDEKEKTTKEKQKKIQAIGSLRAFEDVLK